MDQLSLFILALKIGVSAMVAFWVVSLGRRDASVVDLWWAPGFAVVTLAVWLVAGAPAGGAQLLALGLVLLWSGRLTALFLRRRRAHPGEDPRYTALRRAWEPGFWWKSLFIVFLLQSVLQWVVAFAPLSVISAAPAPAGPLGLLGAAVALAGLALEWKADAELDAHKAGPNAARICDSGLRAIVRYPNYLGEIIFWTGLWLVAAGVGAWWTAVAPALMALLLTRVSGAPILEEGFEGRPGAAEWMRRTPAFLPAPVLRAVARLSPGR